MLYGIWMVSSNIYTDAWKFKNYQVTKYIYILYMYNVSNVHIIIRARKFPHADACRFYIFLRLYNSVCLRLFHMTWETSLDNIQYADIASSIEILLDCQKNEVLKNRPVTVFIDSMVIQVHSRCSCYSSGWQVCIYYLNLCRRYTKTYLEK